MKKILTLIAALNPDFRDFIVRIKNDMTSKEIKKEKYDKVFEQKSYISSTKDFPELHLIPSLIHSRSMTV
ncbi:hypothetical protein [Bacillus sp. V59.32b]|uniref:hypothetical protein n=1 Tax=Bacillus sp. V59.32b TaxID=1758642 RepID=UPI000E3D421A|nr:hypothetical protein [Bacillus sp. V59.32b]RFU68405.1 hypothetical protein D0463_05125 [Bacillus sp. V59.32b]